MKKIEMLNYLTDEAIKFVSDADYFDRNSHLHTIKDKPTGEMVEAVLVGFINSISADLGVDLGLHIRTRRLDEE